jgi:hypothetical protein
MKTLALCGSARIGQLPRSRRREEGYEWNMDALLMAILFAASVGYAQIMANTGVGLGPDSLPAVAKSLLRPLVPPPPPLFDPDTTQELDFLEE